MKRKDLVRGIVLAVSLLLVAMFAPRQSSAQIVLRLAIVAAFPVLAVCELPMTSSVFPGVNHQWNVSGN